MVPCTKQLAQWKKYLHTNSKEWGVERKLLAKKPRTRPFAGFRIFTSSQKSSWIS